MTVKKSPEINDAIIGILNSIATQQAIVVIGEKNFYAELRLYEKTDGSWNLVCQMPAYVGRNGMGKTREGDLRSPTGIFPLETAFGIAPPPAGSGYPYRILTEQDYWVDDNQSADYNRWVQWQPGEPKDWNSAEWLWEEKICYRYAVVIGYNPECRPGQGSAIFLHVRAGEDIPTQGCTAVSEAGMIRILQWLDPEKQPVLIQGSEQDLPSFTLGRTY